MNRKYTLSLIGLGVCGLLTLSACHDPENQFALVKPQESQEEDGSSPLLQVIQEKELKEEQFPMEEIIDKDLAPGERKIVQEGERGQSEIIYEITKEGDQELKRIAISEQIIKRAVPQITHIGPVKGDLEADGSKKIVGYSEEKTPPKVESQRVIFSHPSHGSTTTASQSSSSTSHSASSSHHSGSVSKPSSSEAGSGSIYTGEPIPASSSSKSTSSSQKPASSETSSSKPDKSSEKPPVESSQPTHPPEDSSEKPPKQGDPNPHPQDPPKQPPVEPKPTH